MGRSSEPKEPLEFDGLSEAEAFRDALRELWRRVECSVMQSPRARILETVESKED